MTNDSGDDQLTGEAILVMVAIRSLSIKPADLPLNTLVLGPAASHKMYGPTLSCLASWFDLERRLAMQPNLALEQAESAIAMSSKASGRGRKAADIAQGGVCVEEVQGDSKRRHVDTAASTQAANASAASPPAQSTAQAVHAEPVVSREQSASQASSQLDEVEEPESFDQSK
jgi:hypothetical protein